MTPESIQAMIDQALLRNSTNGDGSHSSHGDNQMNVQTTRPCFYADFMKCQPLIFKGNEGVGLTQWIEKMESVFHISGCPDAYSMTWEVLKKKMTDKYCPLGEIKKLEIKLWNLKMSNMLEDIQYAGSDTRPPMLDRTDFESWQQRIRLYCLGKDNGENIMKSITKGPFQMGTMRDTLTEGGEGALHLGPERARVFADLSAEQKERYKADIHATNILLQGIPKDIYTLINHYTDAKDIWDNVKMILEGSDDSGRF
ncbi:hypothetical protein Tco_1185133 [Tanacetum coccineum]